MADLGLKALNEADSLNPIKNLWRNVLIVAIEDAIRITKLIKKFPHFYDLRRYHSLDYVKLPNRDFNRVCEYAELDHNLTRKKIIEYLERIKNEEITEEAAQDTTINFEGIFGPGFDVSLGEQDATPI